ncbi:MAG: hypothetical protein JWQ74_3216 [Marmoricola sp.]|nr:hypothetical protein [Marmoricola sp.]
MTSLKATTVEITRTIKAPPSQIWAVLSDGWLYPTWVVGASRMRSVEDHWPTPGAKLHHSVGTWPLLLDDRTEVLEMTPQRMLRLRAHGWPGGAAEVLIEIEADGDGSLVRIHEDATQGPGTVVPRSARQLAIAPRNRETLRRLAFIAEGRHATETRQDAGTD